MKTEQERINHIRAVVRGHNISADIMKNFKPMPYNHFQQRDPEDVMKRAIVAVTMAKVTADILDNPGTNKDKLEKEIMSQLKNSNADKMLFPSEKKVFKPDKFSDGTLYLDALTIIAWRIESARILLWYLGLAEDVDFFCVPEDDDPLEVISEQINICEAVIKKYMEKEVSFAVKSCEEVCDYWETVWEMNWILDDAYFTGADTGTISRDIVIERRRAVEWLMHPEMKNWDKVEMDT